ncbi:hypothetical protein CC80DRAFT_549732 [Byssothecium circinans]|uniref:Rhodopsin domain-containing protein n=1 Tax=Byssothecium circinans TaxID=147558 RepID=A0A6A5U1E3_9PLEO|nr:hypothetical protein CC80DRAFT_549732 [Byssothecium circinans]
MAALAIYSIKVSVCFFLLALLRDVHRRFRIFIWSLMAFTTISTFIGLLLWGLQAHPLERLWDPRVKGTRQPSQQFLTVFYIFYAFNLFTDLIYSLTPIWFLWNIQISKRKKYAIWAIMGLGLLLTVGVIMCIIFAQEILETEDITWALIPEFIADCTQRHVSGIIANLPALYTLISNNRGASSTAASTDRPINLLKRLQNRSASGKSTTTRPEPEAIAFESIQKSPNPYSLDTGTDDNIPLRSRGLHPDGF